MKRFSVLTAVLVLALAFGWYLYRIFGSSLSINDQPISLFDKEYLLAVSISIENKESRWASNPALTNILGLEELVGLNNVTSRQAAPLSTKMQFICSFSIDLNSGSFQLSDYWPINIRTTEPSILDQEFDTDNIVEQFYKHRTPLIEKTSFHPQEQGEHTPLVNMCDTVTAFNFRIFFEALKEVLLNRGSKAGKVVFSDEYSNTNLKMKIGREALSDVFGFPSKHKPSRIDYYSWLDSTIRYRSHANIFSDMYELEMIIKPQSGHKLEFPDLPDNARKLLETRSELANGLLQIDSTVLTFENHLKRISSSFFRGSYNIITLFSRGKIEQVRWNFKSNGEPLILFCDNESQNPSNCVNTQIKGYQQSLWLIRVK